MDPFCGSGALPYSRQINFPYAKIIASDIDIKEAAKKLEANSKDTLELIQMNYKNLMSLGANSIDKIVTDPPWECIRKILM